MERAEVARAVEAIVMVADRPIPTELLAELLEVPAAEVEHVCTELAAGYEVDGRGFILNRVAGGWRYQSHPELTEYVERFVLDGQSARLSAAALETLAIVAYKQPLSRAQVAAIRGVNVDGVMRTLEQRGYIAEIGRDPGPGQAVLFGTTPLFLEKLGLESLDGLPPLSEFVPPAEVVEALETGLRPEGAPTASPPGGADAETGAAAPATGAPATGVAGEPGAGDERDGAAAPDEAGPEVDHLARLDETTARLDALVDEVRTRIEAAEAAVAEADPDEGADPEGEPAAAGASEAREPGAGPAGPVDVEAASDPTR